MDKKEEEQNKLALKILMVLFSIMAILKLVDYSKSLALYDLAYFLVLIILIVLVAYIYISNFIIKKRGKKKISKNR
jgi:uncharacterized membrane protein